MRRQFNGFSIIELMVVLTVAGVILAVGVPSFNSQIKNSRLTSSVNDLVAAMHLSRSEASKRNTPVIVCASSNSLEADAESCTDTDWLEGWIVFADNDGSGDFNRGVDDIVQRHGAQNDTLGIIADDDVARNIAYMPNGFANLPLGAESDRFIVYCDDKAEDDRFSRVLAISNSGRPRILSRKVAGSGVPSCEE